MTVFIVFIYAWSFPLSRPFRPDVTRISQNPMRGSIYCSGSQTVKLGVRQSTMLPVLIICESACAKRDSRKRRGAALPWSAVAERGTSADTAFGMSAGERAGAVPPAIPSQGGVALTLPAALQGAARVFGSPLQEGGARRAFQVRHPHKVFGTALSSPRTFTNNEDGQYGMIWSICMVGRFGMRRQRWG